MSQLVFFKNINCFGRNDRGGSVTEIQEGDWLIAGPPWQMRPGFERIVLWELLNDCTTEAEFLERAEDLNFRDNRARDFLSWLKRNWWMVRAVRS